MFVVLLVLALDLVSSVLLVTFSCIDFDIVLMTWLTYRPFHRWHSWNMDLDLCLFHYLASHRILCPIFPSMNEDAGRNFHIVAWNDTPLPVDRCNCYKLPVVNHHFCTPDWDKEIKKKTMMSINSSTWSLKMVTLTLAHNMSISAGIIANSVLKIDVNTFSSKHTRHILFMFML